MQIEIEGGVKKHYRKYETQGKVITLTIPDSMLCYTWTLDAFFRSLRKAVDYGKAEVGSLCMFEYDKGNIYEVLEWLYTFLLLEDWNRFAFHRLEKEKENVNRNQTQIESAFLKSFFIKLVCNCFDFFFIDGESILAYSMLGICAVIV